MRRPFALLGFSCFLALMACAGLGGRHAGRLFLLLLCAAAGCFVLSVIFRRRPESHALLRRVLRQAGCAFLAGAVFSGVFWFSSYRDSVPMETLDGRQATVEGVLTDGPERAYGRFYYTLRVDAVETEGETLALPAFRVRLMSWQPFDAEAYDRLRAEVKFYGFDATGGLYSTRNSRLADGVVLGAYCVGGDAQIEPFSGFSIGKWVSALRERLERVFDRFLPKAEASLIQAVLLGRRDGLSQQITRDFRAAGASHLLVVSGLHLSALAAFLGMFFSRLPLARPLKNLLIGGILLLFLAVIGFPPSAVRGGVMYFIYLLGDAFDREADSLNSLGAAVFLICLFAPYSGGDLGFTLSVGATLGILLFSGEMGRFFRRLCGGRKGLGRLLAPLGASLAVTFSAQLGTLPVVLLVFRGLPLWAPLGGLLLVFPAELLLYTALAAGVLGLVPFLAPMAAPFAFLAGWLTKGLLWLSHGIGRLPGGFLDLSQPVYLVALAGSLLLLLCALRLGRGKSLLLAALAGCVVLFGTGGALLHSAYRGAVTFFVASDASAVVAMKDGHAAVFLTDGYRTGAAADCLLRENLDGVDTAFVQYGGRSARETLNDLALFCPVGRVVLPEGGRVDQMQSAGQEITHLADGELEPLFGEFPVTAENGFSRLQLTVYGVPVALVLGTKGSESHLSVGGITVPVASLTPAQLPPGDHLLPGESGLFIDLYPDGSVRFRGEVHG